MPVPFAPVARRESAKHLAIVIGRGVMLRAFGAASDLVLALAAAGAIASLLHGVEPRDQIAFIAALLGLMLVALIACCARSPAVDSTRLRR